MKDQPSMAKSSSAGQETSPNNAFTFQGTALSMHKKKAHGVIAAHTVSPGGKRR